MAALSAGFVSAPQHDTELEVELKEGGWFNYGIDVNVVCRVSSAEIEKAAGSDYFLWPEK
ncbi:hypothetical protein PAAG_03541 [Paracoccidioides lutzii Pb01]|uniref:Uncharacterized protein n=1 Tax=Paracoccidioides lutzii (strain ATCC MYA-826 / Pb01) TaxID=502779 RepID=C1GXG7_PARBA|nr:hypothetical protein PAAG_03541 [Paracoccidioides lutzii Pb01]EEH41255.2 hypothetical protein PAAG_03541 [Paracoccidioides lutzii Pb01]